MGSVAKLSQMSRVDQRTLLASIVWMPLFSLGLRALGLARCHVWIKRTKLSKAAMTPQEIETCGRLVNLAASRSPFRASCLTRSMFLEWLLRRRGVESQLRIGVSLDGGALDAHAWVEIAGVPVNDRLDIAQQFAPFGSLAPAESSHAR